MERRPVLAGNAFGPAVRLLGVLLLATGLYGRVIRVPADHPTVKGAVFAAQGGDVVEVDDGTYFEEGIRLDKPLTVRARNPYGAVIYGGSQKRGLASIFIVQAPVDVSGFVLKNSRYGLIQRNSPDVSWTASRLFIFNMSRAAVAVQASRGNVGSAQVRELVVSRCAAAFRTSEARSFDARHCLVAGCGTAFQGYNHVSFTAHGVAVLDCGRVKIESKTAPDAGATNRVVLDDVRVVAAEPLGGPNDAGRGYGFDDIFDEIKDSELSRALPQRSRWFLQGLLSRFFGDLCLKAGRPEEARRHFAEALAVGRERGFSELSWPSLKGLADAHRLSGDLRGALDCYTQAAHEVETIRSGYVFKLYNPGYLEDKISLYESMLGLLHDLNRMQPGGGYDRRALELVEDIKARGFTQSLKEAEIFRSLGLARGVLRERLVPNNRINDIQVALQSEVLTPAERAALRGDLDKAHEELKETYIRIRARSPDMKGLPLFKPESVEEIRRRLLDDRTMLLEYFLGEEEAFGLGLTRAGITFVRLGSAKRINDLVARYRRFLAARGGGEFAGQSGGRKLYNLLLSPFAWRMKGIDRLIVVPAESLHFLPFETLIVPGRGRGGRPRYLVEDCAVFYAPSASALMTLLVKPHRADLSLDFLGVSYAGKGEGRPVYLPDPHVFPVLRWAEREIRASASQFDPARVRLLEGNEATESRVLEYPLDRFRILHFAVHGYSDDEFWQRSALLLAPEPGEGRDGFLQLQDIYLLDLNADLVVLSACRTAVGRLEVGEGLTGMALTFLYAGTRAFLSSLWSIPDESGVHLMRTFYRRLTEGRSKSAALREAKTALLGGRFRHPYYWAGFVLIGDDGALVRR